MDVNAFDVAMGAAVLPPVIAVVNQRHWTAQLKGLVALLLCAVYAFVVGLLRGPVDWRDWRDVLLTTAGSAFIAYRTWWQPSGIAPAIEHTTSSRREPPPVTS